MKRLALLTSIIILPGISFAQGEQDAQKARSVIEAAIKARGGDRYLNVKTEVGRGQYTPFDKGVPTIPAPFVDYIVHPDKERTEFGKKKQRFIQTNVGGAGWIYDGQAESIKDQSEEQTKQFLEGMRFNLDYTLRKGWREPEAKLSYIARKEIWRNKFAEGVEIEYKDGRKVSIFFDYSTHLPLMFSYTRETPEGGTTKEEDRFFQWVDYSGIKFPNIIDHYRDGIQTSRINYENVEFNSPVPDSLFAKPATVKEIK